MVNIARAVRLWRLFEVACLATLYGVALWPLWRLPWSRLDSAHISLLATPMVQVLSLLLVASLLHHVFSIMFAPSVRAFVWHGSLVDLQASVASSMFSRSMRFYAWIDVAPGVIALEGERLLLCSRETGYDIQRIEAGDISRLLLVWSQSRGSLIDIVYRARCSGRRLRSTLTFHDDEQASRWFDRLQSFLASDGEARHDRR